MKPYRSAVAAALLTGLAVVAVVVALTTSRDRALRSVALPAHVVPAAQGVAAPELAGISHFDNTDPLTLASLRGRVVLVDFWTYTCINCRRTFPFLRALHQTYPDLTVLGVHSPEFGFEKEHDNVARAVRELDVTWPVAEDPQMATWSAFRNQYWPASYLIDRDGLIRYRHVGEGDEQQTEDAVRALLAEGGHPVPSTRTGSTTEPSGRQDQTPETYLGYERGAEYVEGGPVPTGRTVVRHDRTDLRDKVAIDGRVTGLAEGVELQRGASLTQRFAAREVYATSGPASAPVVVDVTLDGKPVPVGRRGASLVVRGDRTVAVVGKQDLLSLLTGPAFTRGTLRLTALSDGARFFTFTYGA